MRILFFTILVLLLFLAIPYSIISGMAVAKTSKHLIPMNLEKVNNDATLNNREKVSKLKELDIKKTNLRREGYLWHGVTYLSFAGLCLLLYYRRKILPKK